MNDPKKWRMVQNAVPGSTGPVPLACPGGRKEKGQVKATKWDRRSRRCRVLPQPGLETFESKLICPVKLSDESIGSLGVRRDAQAVDREKGIGRGEGDALVAVDEGMVLREAFPKGRRFLDEVGVITGLRAEQGGFEQAEVADASGAAVAFYLVVVDGERFGKREVIGHSASFLYRSPNFSWLAR